MHKLEEVFKNYIKEQGLKWTPERQAIVGEVFRSKDHFEADDLLVRLRQGDRRVSRGSIYRTLKLIEEAGLIRSVVFIDRHTHYERTVGCPPHEHLVCVRCGKIIEFYRKEMENVLDNVCDDKKFKQLSHKVEVTGYCEKCRRTLNNKNHER